MTIEIKNLRKEKPSESYDVRVDRISVLGNPFFMKNETQRNNVCDRYQKQFDYAVNDIENGEKPLPHKIIIVELNYLISLYKQHGKLRLFCWCSPLRCHAESIKNYILSKI